MSTDIASILTSPPKLSFINSFGIFQSYYVSHLAVAPSDVSWIGSIQISTLFIIGTFTGRATDAGYFRACLLSGSILEVLGVMMTSLSTQYWHLLLSQGVCVGIANGLLVCPCIAVVATYFPPRKRGVAMAITLTGSATGGITFPLIAQHLLPRIGFSWTIRVFGFITLGNSVTANAFMEARLPPRRTGSIVDWPAFKEAPYVLFGGGMVLVFFGLFFAFFYVRVFLPVHFLFLTSHSTSGKLLRQTHHPRLIHIKHHSPNRHERSGNPRPIHPWLYCRQVHWLPER